MKTAIIFDGPSQREIQLSLFDGDLLKTSWLYFMIEKDICTWAVRIIGAERSREHHRLWKLTGRATRVEKICATPGEPEFEVVITYNVETKEGSMRCKGLPLGSAW